MPSYEKRHITEAAQFKTKTAFLSCSDFLRSHFVLSRLSTKKETKCTEKVIREPDRRGDGGKQ